MDGRGWAVWETEVQGCGKMMERFWKRYLINLLTGSPVAFLCVVGIVRLTGAGHTASAFIGLACGISLVLVSSSLAVRSITERNS